MRIEQEARAKLDNLKKKDKDEALAKIYEDIDDQGNLVN